jgi:hypothetical protein
MSSYNPGLVLPVIVTTSNQWLDVVVVSTTYAATITPATYYSLASLGTAVDAALTSDATGSWTIGFSATSLTYSGWSINLTLAATNAKFKWATGAHASSNAHTILGFSSTTDSESNDYFKSDYNLPNVWVSNRAPASDTFDRRKHSGGEARESINGAHHVRLAVARPRTRKVEFENIAKQRTLDVNATGAYTNMAFESFWERAITGEQFAYYNDWTTCATAAKSSGNYYLVEPDDMMDMKRTHVGTEVYSFGLTMQRKET